MQRDIHFKGTLQFRSKEALEQAVAAARMQLDDDDVTDPSLASLRTMVARGTKLSVDIKLPRSADVRFAAAAMFEALAEHAVDGAVEVYDDTGPRRDGRVISAGVPIDVFPSGSDD